MCVYRYAFMGDWDGVGVYHLYAVGGKGYALIIRYANINTSVKQQIIL